MPVTMEQIVNLSKRRGFVFPSAEIYGGLGGFWDWGPLGLKLKNNIKAAWWKDFVLEWDDVVGLDGSIITNPKVWEASGHVKKFTDFVIACLECQKRYKAEDYLPNDIQQKIVDKTKSLDSLLEQGKISGEEAEKKMKNYCRDFEPELNKKLDCPHCQKKNWNFLGYINTMFRTGVGPVPGSSILSYLRPETAQSIFVNFDNVRETMRLKVPFGIAQIGKAFRNEITPGNFIFRSREFEQMELEYFVPKSKANEYYKEFVDSCYQWFIKLGIKEASLKRRPYDAGELAHYASATTDIEFAFPIEKGWAELMGIANRTDYDLRQHGQFAKGDEQAFAVPVDAEGKIKEVPYVIEPSMGVDRAALAFLLDAYDEVEGGRSTTTESIKEKEVVLRLHKTLAPYQAAILPLSKKPELQKVAHHIAQTLRPNWSVDYDETGSIGKRYRRQDEIGTPYCVTVDFDTVEGGKRQKGTVTVRDRDSMAQENIAVEELTDYFREKLS